jgi:hypothetical protein
LREVKTDRLLLRLDDSSDLIRLKLRDPEPDYFLSLKRRQQPPAFSSHIDSIPGDVLDSRDSRLVQAFNAENSHLIKDHATMLESIVRRSGICAKRLLTSQALVPSYRNQTEYVSDDLFSRRRAFSVGTLETLHHY